MKRASSKGQSLIETTLILAAFVILLAGAAGFGELIFIRQTLAQRAHDAARWGALHGYDSEALRNIVLYGAPTPDKDTAAFMALHNGDVEVSNPNCPGPDCRIRIAIPAHGILSVEPLEAF